MRLIDADEIIKETWRVVIMGETVSVISRKDIDNAPTVEAIPVEYIEKFKKEVRDVTNGKAVIDWLLEDWERENARD